MRCAPSRPRHSRRHLASARFALAGLLVVAPALAATPPEGFVYCQRGTGPELKVFAAEPTADNSLLFGLSLWMPNGHHFGL